MRMTRQIFLSVVLMALATSAFAHHSPARFQTDQVVAVQGTVVAFDWRNPHVYLTIEDDDGAEWLMEANATSILRRNGWARESFSQGDVVTVRANPNRDPARTHASLISVIAADGTEFSGRSGNRNAVGTDPDARADSPAGVWRGEPSLAFRMLFAMIDHPLTEKGAAARDAYDESMDPVASCVPWPTPRLVAWNAFYLVELDIGEQEIRFRSEFDNVERIIHMDGRPHPKNGERTNQGHSIGWWEDGTLVVDTRLFADSRSPVADGIPSGEQKHVIERYTLTEDGRRMTVDLFVEDPEYLAEPFTGQVIWHYAPHLDMLRFDCDPEVAGRFIQ